MSFNVNNSLSESTGWVDTDPKRWTVRKHAVKNMLATEKPAVVGGQEVTSVQLNDIAGFGYGAYGVGRTDGGTTTDSGEMMGIFYDESQVSLVDKGTFWLSKTPDMASTGWDATIKRTTTWVLLKEKTSGNQFYFFNTHLDHAGVEAQNEGAKLIRARMESMNKAGLPVLLTGDMNVEQSSNVLLNFKMDNIRKTAPVTDTKVTCHGYGSKSQRIDHIFYEGFIPHKFETINQTWAGMKYISDHNPVMAVVEF
jgi:endonuclease/exonuclease/phosphatase family metal-dependent hydrolase